MKINEINSGLPLRRRGNPLARGVARGAGVTRGGVARVGPMLFLTFYSNFFFSNFWLMIGKLWEARSRLYRRQILQVNTEYSFESS